VTDAERRVALDAIATEVAVCKLCRLHQGRTKAVPGEGTSATEVVFVGDPPGFNEDKQGRPFVGPAGSLLDELLASVGWSREEVFITNIVKCRPPGNRDPEPDEIAACGPFLERQLAVLEPALVVTLGRFSMGRFRPGARISQAHGTFTQADQASAAAGAMTFSMYHPAAALHQGSLKETLFRDMQGVPTALLDSRSARAAAATQTTAPEMAAPEPESASPDGEAPEPPPGVNASPPSQPDPEIDPAAQLPLF
jgi:DNA polymerase